MMGDARAAVAAKKEQQSADKKLDVMAGMKSRIPGTTRGFANQYGTGQATTLTPEQFANRKPATTPLSRSQGTSIPLRDEIDFMKKMQSRSIKK
jgi:hypothetical protein